MKICSKLFSVEFDTAENAPSGVSGSGAFNSAAAGGIFSTIAADGVICADAHDVLWILGRLFVACMLLRFRSSFWQPYGDVIRSKYSLDLSYLLEASLQVHTQNFPSSVFS